MTFEAKAKDFKMCPRGRPRGQGRPIGKSRFSRKKFLFTLERTIHAYKKCWSTLNDEVENVLNFLKNFKSKWCIHCSPLQVSIA